MAFQDTYLAKKKRHIYCPKIVTPKRYLRTIICIYIALGHTSRSHLHKGNFLFPHLWQKYLTVPEIESNSEKHARRMRNEIIFIFIKSTNIH